MNTQDILTLRQDMEDHMQFKRNSPPMGLENKGEFFVFLAGFMAPWCLEVVDGKACIEPGLLRGYEHKAGELCELAQEGHVGQASTFLHRHVLLPAIKKGNFATVLMSCHQAYWKVTPYPDFTRAVGSAVETLFEVHEPNTLGLILRQPDALLMAYGVAFMLPGLIANRTDYWEQRFIRAGADPADTMVFLKALQNYWDATLPR